MHIDLVSRVLFLFREGDSCRLWPESTPFCEVSKRRQGVVSNPGTSSAEDRCPVGSCHTSHPHTLLSLVRIRQHHPTLPCTGIFNLQNLLSFPCKYLKKGNMEANAYNSWDLVLSDMVSFPIQSEKNEPCRRWGRPRNGVHLTNKRSSELFFFFFWPCYIAVHFGK